MKNLYFIFFLVCFLACKSDGPMGSNNSIATMGHPEMDMAIEESEFKGEDQNLKQGQSPSPESVERKLIKHAELRFQVNALEESTKRIQEIAQTYAGFVSNMNQSNSNYSFDNRMQVKIPSDKFDSFLTAIESESIYTDYKNINSNDVTEEFTDINIRLKTKKDVRDRYIDILRTKAKTVKDILDAEDKIRRIQEEIESMEGRLKYLNDRVAYSNIVINIYQRVEGKVRKDIYSKSFFTKLKESFVSGGELFVNLVLFLINLWPLLLILISLLFFRDKIARLFRRKK